MCTGIVVKNSDELYAYNLDIDPNQWDYHFIMNDKFFGVAITVGKTTYYTHGVNKEGRFACLPYMNDSNPFKKLRGIDRIDLLVNRYLKNKITYKELKDIVLKKDISNVKYGSLHSIFIEKNKKGFIVEPGCKSKIIDKYDVITNYPLLKECKDDNVFYGKDRYQKVMKVLRKHTDNIDAKKMLTLLKKVSQTGQYGTKLSFAYSKNENAVYYILNNDGKIKTHEFK